MHSLTILWTIVGSALYALIALGWYLKLSSQGVARNKLVATYRIGFALLWLPMFILIWFAGLVS